MSPEEARTRREKMIDILVISKANGCDAYITPEGKMLYGAIVFPDGIQMHVYEASLTGWDFAIPYIPSRENGNACRCNKKNISHVTWDILLDLKANGITRVKEIGAVMYTAEEWLQNRGKEFIKL